MKKDPKIFLLDILESISKIEEYTKNVTENKFLTDDKLQDAVMKRLAVIGEAAKNIPERIKKQYPEIPWPQISGMRNVIIHEYFGIVMKRIWDTIQKDLPKLKKQIEKILKKI